MKLNFGGFQPVSLCDDEEPTSIVFFRGCNFGCPYCHNKEITKGYNWIEIEIVEEMLKNSSKLINGVIFSGGEPCQQPEQLIRLCEYVKSLGLFIGIETNGSRPDVINSLVQKGLLDKVFLDIKYPLTDPIGYANFVKVEPGFLPTTRVKRTLQICLINDIQLEIRTVAHSQIYLEDIEQIKEDVKVIAYETGGKEMPKFRVLKEMS